MAHRLSVSLSVLLLISAAAFAQDGSTDSPDEGWPLGRAPTVFAFDGRYSSELHRSPMSYGEWVPVKLRASVPVLDKETHMADVVSELQDWSLKPIIRDQSVVVREGPSRHNFAGPNKRYFLYGFDNDQLILGPIKVRQSILNLVADGLTPHELKLLNDFERVVGFNAESLNNIAWSIATYDGSARRDTKLAIEYAIRANKMSDWSSMPHLDTLAAAYASDGNFQKAVVFQRFANTAVKGNDAGVLARLALYENNLPYIETPTVSASSPEEPPDALRQRAEAGDADAQYKMAVFYLQNEIDRSKVREQPGKYWLQLAADQGHGEALDEIGFGFLNGAHGFDVAADKALPILRERAAAGSATSSYNLGRMYREGIAVDIDDALAAKYFIVAADNGLLEAALEMAFRYRFGTGVNVDLRASEKYYALAFDANYGPYDYFFADSYMSNAMRTVEFELPSYTWEESATFLDDLVRRVRHIEREVAANQAYITVSVGESVIGWPADHAPQIALALSLVAATLGSTDAASEVAKAYRNSEALEPSEKRYHYWMTRSKRLGK